MLIMHSLYKIYFLVKNYIFPFLITKTWKELYLSISEYKDDRQSFMEICHQFKVQAMQGEPNTAVRLWEHAEKRVWTFWLRIYKQTKIHIFISSVRWLESWLKLRKGPICLRERPYDGGQPWPVVEKVKK
jgi:hypothetical protein